MNDKVYCLIRAESSVGDELRLTPPSPPLDEGDSLSYSLHAGLVWGTTGPRDPEGNLLITYDCFEQDSDSQWSTFFEDLSAALTAVGSEPGGWGAAVGVAAGIVAKLIALDGDDHLLNAQQVLDASTYLEAAKGTSWTVRKSGMNLNSLWDWRLNMELWGCAEYGGS